MKTSQKLALISTLYLAQGLPYGFFLQALPAVMREQKYSLETIGLTSLLALPWGLKFLWAPLVDRYGSARFGKRKSYIVPLQILTVALLLALAAIAPEGSMTIILGAVFLVNLLAATQDVATDGLAIDLLEPRERGLANGVQVAGYRVGMILGGGALLAWYGELGWRGTFLIMAGIVALTSVPIAFFREPPPIESGPQPAWSFLRRKGALSILGLVFSYKLGAYLLQGMLRPYLVDGGLTLSDIGWLLGTIGFGAGLAGAMTGGVLLEVISRKRALIAFGIFQTLTVLAFALIPEKPLDRTTIAILSAFEHFASGLATTALFTSMMDWSSKSTAAADYTLQASTVVMSTGVASALSGFIAGAIGYRWHFAFAALVVAIGAALAAMLFPQENDDGTLRNLDRGDRDPRARDQALSRGGGEGAA